MPPPTPGVESYRVVHPGIFAVGKSLLQRKNELAGGENRDYSGGGARIFVESTLLLSSNCVTPNVYKSLCSKKICNYLTLNCASLGLNKIVRLLMNF